MAKLVFEKGPNFVNVVCVYGQITRKNTIRLVVDATVYWSVVLWRDHNLHIISALEQLCNTTNRYKPGRTVSVLLLRLHRGRRIGVKVKTMLSQEFVTAPETLHSPDYDRRTAALAELYSPTQIELPDGTVKQLELYDAAKPGFPRNFSRDSLATGLLLDSARDRRLLLDQIAFSAYHQGAKRDPVTGEQPGDIHHEYPGYPLREGLLTTYNGCDTAALFLTDIIAQARSGDADILDTYKLNIERATGYILSHVGGDMLFREDPRLAGADKFSLHVTYWKDSVLNDGSADGEITNYPIVYSLAHFQNADALAQLAKVTGADLLASYADGMLRAGIEKLREGNHFITALDGKGRRIDPVSSDSLYSLLYIKPELLPTGFARDLAENYMAQLETGAGYRSGIPANADMQDQYHMYVWSHEQAFLHAALRRHGLTDLLHIPSRITEYFGSDFPELIHPVTYQKYGNPLQLWVVGASEYFEDPDNTLLAKLYSPEAAEQYARAA